MLQKDTHWKSRAVIDFLFAVFEAVVVLAISGLSLIILSIYYGLNTVGVDFIDATITTITSTLNPTEMIVYVTGILSSTTAYFLVRLNALTRHTVHVIIIFAGVATVFWLATPLFIVGLETTPINQEFTWNLAITLGVGTLALWLYSLFIQRQIFKMPIPISGDERGNEIARNVENS